MPHIWISFPRGVSFLERIDVNAEGCRAFQEKKQGWHRGGVLVFYPDARRPGKRSKILSQMLLSQWAIQPLRFLFERRLIIGVCITVLIGHIGHFL